MEAPAIVGLELRFGRIHNYPGINYRTPTRHPDGIVSALDLGIMKTAATYASMRGPSQRVAAGIALAEVIIGMALILVVLGLVFAMNGQLLSLLNQSKQSTYASQVISERVEQLRTCGWRRLTRPGLLEDEMSIVQRDTATAVNLPGITETIRVEPYTDPAGRFVQVVRSASGTTQSGVNIDGEPLVKLSIKVQWTSGKRQRERNFVTVVSPYRREQPDEA